MVYGGGTERSKKDWVHKDYHPASHLSFLKKIRKLIFVFQSPNNCYKTVLFQHKALVAAQLENAIEKELLERLKKGTVSNGLLWHK